MLHAVEDELLDWDDREQFVNFSCASIGGRTVAKRINTPTEVVVALTVESAFAVQLSL